MPRAKRSPLPEPPPPPKLHPLASEWGATPKFHQVGKCRWCRGRFVFVFGEQWICETPTCAERQIANALTKAIVLPNESPYLFLPLPLQVEIEELTAKRLLVWGPVGISKSFGLRRHLYARCRKIPGYRALLLRATYDQLYKNHLQFMHQEAAELGDATFKMPGGGKPAMMTFENGSAIFMGYLDDESDIAQHMGPEWDEVDVDEANHIIEKGLQKVTSRDRGSKSSYKTRMALGIEDGRSRLLSNIGGRAWPYLETFYIDKNPDPQEYPFYDPAEYGAITGDLEDNPYLTSKMRSSVLGGLDADTYAQLAEGRRDVFPGQFFRHFDRKVHVIGDPS